MKFFFHFINYSLIFIFIFNLVNSKNDPNNIINLNYNSNIINKFKKDIIHNEEDEEDIYLNGEYEKEIILNKDNNKKYIFHLNNSEYIYFFETDEIEGFIHYGNDIPCPNFCAVQFNQSNHDNIIYINFYKNATEKSIVVKISSSKDFKGQIKSIKTADLIKDSINPISVLKTIFIFESYNDYILYLKSIDDSISIKCTEYNKEMTKTDIININDRYYRNCNNRINELKLNTIYIFSILSESYNKPFEILLQPKNNKANIEIIDDKTNFLFLSNTVNEYSLDFNKNKVIRSIQLSRDTIDSEITIESSEINENIKLNKDNLYYLFNNENSPFKGILSIKITNGKNALIKFLFKYNENNADFLNDKEYINYNISKEITIIKFSNNHKNKFININIFSENNKNFKLSMISGYAKGNYFLNSSSNQISNLEMETSSVDIKIYNENITLEENEYFYLFLFFEEEKLSNNTYELFLNKIDKYSIDDINVDFSEEKCKIAIDSLIKLFNEGYIYTDIKKNPPNIEYFGATDIIEDLNNIKVRDRKYYDFFRDIKRILGKIKDGHLNIAAMTSPNGYNLQMMSMCLPFSFYIEGKSLDEAKIYIKKFDTCFEFFNSEQQEFIKNHEGKYLKSINNTDPFNYIQNIQSEFNSFYNKHSTFTYSMRIAHQISIFSNPLSKEQFKNITFIFENDEKITLDYYLNNRQEQLINNKEFMYFYNKEMSKQIKTFEAESILEIEKKYYSIKNNINNLNENDTIEWQYSTLDGSGIKCRVDEKNKINVFVQTTFYFLFEEYNDAIEVVENCTELFYSNSYPITGIESYNGGGVCKLSFYFQELLQVKILPTPHYSVKLSNLMKEYVESNISAITTDPDMYQRINIETCKPFSKFGDMKEIIDDYGKGVTHKRSQYFGIFNSSDLKKHKKRREKYFEMNKLKKPTEIIIFTDTFSFSATSFFIKGLQETGAAILVGYFGNPKNNEIVDASQSPSFVGDFSNSDIFYNLQDVGFQIRGVTIYESYNYTYQEKNPTPREYLIHPVDERINIFSSYDDSLYENFISEAIKIFKKYNEDNECNPDNLELLYEPNNNECYNFENDSHAHGGYECDKETKRWSKICKPFYCDIGYYFDKYQNKCIKDICTEVKDDGDDDNPIKIWMIIVIIVSAILIIVIIIIIISKYRNSKNRLSRVPGESGLLLSSRASEEKNDEG